jgi:hypothetical protein
MQQLITTGFALVILMLSVGCELASGPDDEVSVNVRDGVVQIFEAPKVNQAGLDILALQKQGAVLVDVAREGDLIVATILVGTEPTAVWHSDPACTDCPMSIGAAGGSAAHHFIVSEDQGLTWTERPFERAEGLGSFVRGVHVGGGRAIVVTSKTVDNPMGKARTYPSREIDLVTGRTVPNPNLESFDFVNVPYSIGNKLVAQALWTQLYGTTSRISLQSFDFDTSEIRVYTVDGAAGVYPWGEMISADGLTFDGFGSTYTPRSLCDVKADVNSAEPLKYSTCVDAYALPPEAMRSPFAMTVASTGTVGVLSSDAGSFVLQMVNGQPKFTSLGAGFFSDTPRLHQPFGNLIRLRSEGVSRLVDFKANGTDLVEMPVTPCPDGSTCGTRVDHEWSLPLGNDEFLNFYTVETMDWPSTHQFFYVSRDKATRQAFTDTTEISAFSGTGLRGYPNAVEAGKVEQTCMAAAACGITVFEDCMIHWLTGPFGNPSLNLFRAASLEDCNTFTDFWPERALIGTGACDNICRNGVLMSVCSGGNVAETIGCQYYGATCRQDGYAPSCSDFSAELIPDTCSERGSAVTLVGGFLVAQNCPALGGQTCLPGVIPGIVVCGFPPETAAACEGDVAVLPDPGGGPTQKVDCSLQSRRCVMKDGKASCEAPAPQFQCTANINFLSECEGPYYIYCVGVDEMHYIDCRKLGKTCVNVGADWLFSGTPMCI